MEVIKSYTAACDIPRNSLVKFSTTEDKVTLATAAADLVLGATLNKDVKTGEIVDVRLLGLGEVKFGGTVAKGEAFCAGTGGKAVKAAAGSIVAGFSLKDAVSGDIATAIIVRSQIPAAVTGGSSGS